MPHGVPSLELDHGKDSPTPHPTEEHTGPKAMLLRLLGKVLEILFAFF